MDLRSVNKQTQIYKFILDNVGNTDGGSLGNMSLSDWIIVA